MGQRPTGEPLERGPNELAGHVGDLNARLERNPLQGGKSLGEFRLTVLGEVAGDRGESEHERKVVGLMKSGHEKLHLRHAHHAGRHIDPCLPADGLDQDLIPTGRPGG